MVYILVFILVCDDFSAGATAQILEPPHNQTVPVNSVAIFICKTIGLVSWNIEGFTYELSLEAPTIIDLFRVQGFTLDRKNKSLLLVNTTLINRRTSIHCKTGQSLIALNETSEVAVLTVFGE